MVGRRPVDLTPDKVSGWYTEYTSKRGRWETLAREPRTTVPASLQQPSDDRAGAGIASDNGHACNAHFFAEALAETSEGTVHRYEFRAAGGHPGQEFPGRTLSASAVPVLHAWIDDLESLSVLQKTSLCVVPDAQAPPRACLRR